MSINIRERPKNTEILMDFVNREFEKRPIANIEEMKSDV
jgi:hypothetical protein